MSDILIIEDERSFALALKEYLSLKGFKVDVAYEGEEGLKKAQTLSPSIILIDLFLPDTNGIDLIPSLTQVSSVVIVITGGDDVSLAVESMKRGAHDYLVKPIDLETLYLKLERLYSLFPKPRELVAESLPMRRVVEEIKIAARAGASVLILGETGVGKEVVAREIYRLSGRKGKFVAVNVSSVPEGVFESELFGHRKGAFTGADYEKKGLLEEADQGIFFLDEITEMPHGLQAKLLRVLETKEVRRIGESKERRVDFKLISSSNLPLEEVKKKLREDLFYRISTFTIEIPPLRERREDILPLARHFLWEFGKEKGIMSISPAAEQILLKYSWPGNVRELRNQIERACLICNGKVLEPIHFSVEVREGMEKILPLEEMERRYIRKVLALCGGNKSEAARILGISRPTLRKKLKET